ncbi:MAG TPA: tetratricopeptide repeat protein, partial [Stellaceae bacterium]|nr:tetratricopeptide repeat protein [Stellaceae bacterium]
CYDRALALYPDHPETLSNRGIALHHLGQFAAALASFDRALALAPGLADAHANRASALRELRHLPEALASFRRAARLQSGNAEMQANLARALTDRAAALAATGQFDEALAAAEEALERRPDLAEAHHNRSLALHARGRFDAALASAERALALRPGFAEAHHNRGVVLQAMARFDEALGSYQEALRHRPDFAAAHCAEGSCRLLCGDLEQGWAKYEWRWQADGAGARAFSVPQWRGNADLAGKTILLHAEQGFGDTIQFCRYAPLVAQQGASVLLEAQPPLLPLLRTLAGPVQVVAQGETLPAFDLHSPLLSLPLAFGTTLDTIPASIPYLAASPDRIDKLAMLLPPPTSLRVGLVWSGNPAHRNDRNRSMALERLAPLLAVPDIACVSLQRDLRADEAAALPRYPAVCPLGAALGDFADAAAIVASLDLVIAVDTAVAHLAGALGKRCWLLLPHLPDWRWLLDREDSPWYPTLRLFRQPAPGDWDSVIARVAGELMRLASLPRGAAA